MLKTSTDVRSGNIVIVDDHSLIATALCDLIAQYSRSATVYTCQSLAAAVSTLRFTNPDLIIVDLNLPDASGASVVSIIRSAAPCACVVVISGNDEVACTIPEINNGTVPFVHKGMAQHEISRTIRELLRRCGLADGVRANEEQLKAPPFTNLSPRQWQILRLLATGRSNHEIADSLHISSETIKSHLHDIFAKLQVKNRTQAVLLYQRQEAAGNNGFAHAQDFN